ncbi:MAG: hypothetical protein EBS26_01290 [Bacteroidia bacterium]|nr:hypothetical protein [Bacteroidia bacterium]
MIGFETFFDTLDFVPVFTKCDDLDFTLTGLEDFGFADFKGFEAFGVTLDFCFVPVLALTGFCLLSFTLVVFFVLDVAILN